MVTAIRILVADDHPGVRSAVCADLEDAGFEVCAQVADAEWAVAAAVAERPEVCLLDVRMPGGGLAAAWEITARVPETKVVMLTMSEVEENMIVALRAGAVGYVFKDVEGAELASRIRAFVDGEVQMSASVAARVLDQLSESATADHRLLRRKHAQEHEPAYCAPCRLLELLRDGATLAEATERIRVSAADAREYIAEIMASVRYPDMGAVTAAAR
jgi:DNA-binding NarL/FixJ family response regulator